MSRDPQARGEAFLSRWSRRKQAEPDAREREDALVEDEVSTQRGLPAQPEPPKPQAVPADLPSIDSLTPNSDFTRFMRPDVPPAARNAAMKKLFGDPHFNVMDGLDIYIDDYTKPDPIPLAMLKDLAQSRMLRLFDHEDEKAVEPAPAAADAAPAVKATTLEAALPRPVVGAPETQTAIQPAPDRTRVDQG